MCERWETGEQLIRAVSRSGGKGAVRAEANIHCILVGLNLDRNSAQAVKSLPSRRHRHPILGQGWVAHEEVAKLRRTHCETWRPALRVAD